MKQIFTILLLLAAVHCIGRQQAPLRGTVLDAGGRPLAGAGIRTLTNTTVSGPQGRFRIMAGPGDTLQVSYTGFTSRRIPLQGISDTLSVVLQPLSGFLQEVQVYTGYQRLPAERATGSFAFLDSALLSRRVSTGILGRLEDVTPGLLFHRSGKTSSILSIRGQNTVAANAEPLIVMDNFPYEGDIDQINPADVESVTILKDAAAASVWGARAGNGVIVITTRKGRYGQKSALSFSSGVQVQAKPDPYYRQGMPVSDYIDTERRLFSEGYYTNTEASDYHQMLTPVVELLVAARDGRITGAEADAQIEAMKQTDTREEVNHYISRAGLSRQYSLTVSGGGALQNYVLGAGYDRNRGGSAGTDNSRFTLHASQGNSFFKGRLEMQNGLYYVSSQGRSVNDTYISNYPYARLRNGDGTAAVVTRDYRTGFIQEAESRGLLNWEFRPLEEQKGNNKVKNVSYRLNSSLKYRLFSGLTLSALYQYAGETTDGRDLHDAGSWYARNLVNTFTQAGADGSLQTPVPPGAVLDLQKGGVRSHDMRAQVNYEKSWGVHQLSLMAGAERREQYTLSDTYRMYGYDAERTASTPVDYRGFYPSYVNSADYQVIPSNESETDLTDRFLSRYASIAWTYGQRYTVSAGARTDKSNLFGVRTNQKGVPLYSAGIAWNVSRESFFPAEQVPLLKLRFTYGLNGNSFTNYYAFTTASIDNGNYSPTLLPFARIDNPPNPDLRWERTRMINAGADFELKGRRLSGSFDAYFKKSTGLLGQMPVPSSTGVSYFRGNFGSTKGSGFDLTLNSRNLEGRLSWQTALLASLSKDRIVEYNRAPVVSSSVLNGELNTAPGRPLYSISSYAWAGLDPQSGDPQGYLGGEISKDYNAMIAAATFDNIIYHGYSEPPFYGSVRNTLNWKGLSVSANITFRLGYYFRRESVKYSNNYGLGTYGDYELRWKGPQDGASAFVPSVPAQYVAGRDEFYQYSPVLVDKGDHIRLQDLRAGYTLGKKITSALALRQLQVYGYADNIGLIWKATRFDTDPDYPYQLPRRSFAIGIKADL